MLEIDPELRIDANCILEDSWIKPRNFKFEIMKLAKGIKIWTLLKKQDNLDIFFNLLLSTFNTKLFTLKSLIKII